MPRLVLVLLFYLLRLSSAEGGGFLRFEDGVVADTCVDLSKCGEEHSFQKIVINSDGNVRVASDNRLLQAVKEEKYIPHKHGEHESKALASSPTPSPVTGKSRFLFQSMLPLSLSNPTVVPASLAASPLPAANSHSPSDDFVIHVPSPSPTNGLLPSHSPHSSGSNDRKDSNSLVPARNLDDMPSLVGRGTSKKHTSLAIYISIAVVVLCLLSLTAMYIFWRRRTKKVFTIRPWNRTNNVITVRPWPTGLSGQLRKAFVTGVPSLGRSEIERACEDLSNIIGSLPNCMVYKGTLSSGVEIAVTSTIVTSAQDWSSHSEALFKKKISILSKLNHKNFMNLLGYCVEGQPFTRMMVFEYAPNGTLFEHLHIKEAEHLDWVTRLRIAMGIAYCLEHMLQQNPPFVLRNLHSSSIYLTEDYAAKLSDIGFWNDENDPEAINESTGQRSPALSAPESVVYKFGIILLELISGRLPFSTDDGLLVLWASGYLTGQRPLKEMVDPTLQSFSLDDITALCEVILPCINPNPMERPTMTEVSSQLRKITTIAPERAIPKLSSLWWAELEILSLDN